MKQLALLISCFAVTVAGLAFFTEYQNALSLTRVGGLPSIGIGPEGGAWLSIFGAGVLVIGGGAGVVSIGIYGAGILFATGQLAVGLVAMGQLGLGLLLYLGQLGVGLQVGGQGGLGWRRWIQDNNRDEAYFRSMWAEIAEVLSLWRKKIPRTGM